MIKDRLINGAIAGAAGAVVQNLYAAAARLFGYTGPGYITYGKIVLAIEDNGGLLSNSLGLVSHLVWDIIVGILFAYIISSTTSRYYIWKGMLYGAAVWYLIKAGATIFKIPIIMGFYPETVVFFFIGALIYGLVVSYSLKVLDTRLV
ncbi:hypothetical protein [Phosphitispora fastidiosa]|uniref:hypothetical protein n=1 Tax=Phosphitispora fastidiosa TaxID=2837202 RepID=UPI001E2BB46E|nr:hypothetical protein [Phosphitispora fastidiosa]MBU7005227.1 hypothetical protein [Phosphitispora fastidiosa]